MAAMFIRGVGGLVLSFVAIFILLLAGCVSALSQAGPSTPSPTENYLHFVELDESGKFFLYWKFDEVSITFEIHVRTKGWVGLGMSPNGGMRGSDIFIGWIKDGQPFFQDRFAIGNEQPVIDDQQDYELLEARETDTFTMFKIKRKLQTCDEWDRAIQASTVRTIFAWNDEDPVSVTSVQYHGSHRGSKSLILLNYALPDTDMQTQNTALAHFDMTVNQVNMSSDRTMYWCRITKLPEMKEKHHIVSGEPVIQPGNEGLVHHIIAYFCHGELEQEEHGHRCWEDNMPENVTDCNTIAFAWAVGMGIYHVPEEAGIPVGGPGSPSFFQLEMHYDNPEGVTGVTDSSGLRFYYTDQLRKYDSGVFFLGHSIRFPPMLIPPKAESFRIDAFCSKSCTDKYIPKEGITVYGGVLHTHLLGTKIWTRHIRDGKELPNILHEENYDFNYQQLQNLPTPTKILPGDEFTTSCVYNSKGRTNVTYGGPGTDDEMCFSFLFYYPQIPLQACLSITQEYLPIHQLVMEKAMTGQIYIDPDEDENVYHYLDALEWNDGDVHRLQREIELIPGFRQECVASNEGFGVFGGADATYEKMIEIKEPLQKIDQCATHRPTSSAMPLAFTIITLIVTMTTVVFLVS